MGFMDKLVNLQNVTPGAIAVLTCPLGLTYDKIRFKLGGGLTPDHLTLIEGKANGRRFFVDSGRYIAKRRAYKGIPTNDAFVTLDWTEINARGGAVPQYVAAIPSNLLSQLTFEISISGTAPAGSTLTAEAEGRPPTSNANIGKLLDFNQPFPAAGEGSLFLPTGSSSGGIIKRLWLHSSHITAVDLRLNNQSIYRADLANIQEAQIENNLVPQAGLTVIDFIADGNLMGALNTISSSQVEVRLTMDAGDNVHGYIEYIDAINRL